MNPEGLENIIKRPKEVTCNECNIVSTPKYQLEKRKDGEFIYSDGSITLCNKCMSKGWTDNPQEIIDAFQKDPTFKLGVKSPYVHKKY